MKNSRIWHFIKKELIQVVRDKRMLMLALFAPLIQLFLFGYVASTDINHVSTAVWDESRSQQSRAYVESVANSGYFDINYYVESDRQIKELLDSGRVKVTLHLPNDFAKKIIRREPAPVQTIIDGENSSSATIILGYLNQISLGNRPKPIDARVRVWYNPELKSKFFMVPAIFALTLMIQSMMLTSFSIVKEKEKGTMEQLMVSPIRPYELILGKLLPFVIIGAANIILVFLLVTLWFGVPIFGSPILLFVLGLIFIATGLGIGVFVSTISQPQGQAMMSNIFFLMPTIIISGFIFPIENMPKVIQAITYLIPARYFLVIVRGIFLKGIGLKYLWPQAAALIIFGAAILTFSILRFRKKID